MAPFESLGTLSYSHFASRIFSCFWDIQRRRMAWPWVMGCSRWL